MRLGTAHFLVAFGSDEATGCGAVHLISPDEAELKRMYVADAARGMGVGRALLVALEDAARELGAKRLVLETGVRQPEAIGLYESAGFERIEPFGGVCGI